MKKLFIIAVCIIGFMEWTHAQTITQTVKGIVTDQTTREEIYGATIMLVGSDPIMGTTTGFDGTFALEKVPVGRQSFEIRMVGYESYYVRDILVSSGKEVILNISMKEDITNLSEVIVTYKADKDKAINEMATVSRQTIYSGRNTAVCRRYE